MLKLIWILIFGFDKKKLAKELVESITRLEDIHRRSDEVEVIDREFAGRLRKMVSETYPLITRSLVMLDEDYMNRISAWRMLNLAAGIEKGHGELVAGQEVGKALYRARKEKCEICEKEVMERWIFYNNKLKFEKGTTLDVIIETFSIPITEFIAKEYP
jgi:hypothetical protein